MVEPITVSLGVIAASLIAKASEKAVDRVAEEAVEAGGEAVGGMVGWLRGKLTSSKELAVVEAAPDSKRAVEALGNVIDAEILDEADLQQLVRWVESAQRQEATQTAVGSHIYQANEHSSISVTHVSRRDSPTA